MNESINTMSQLTVGLDLGDRKTAYCLLDEEAVVSKRGFVPTTPQGLLRLLDDLPTRRVIVEVGTHSPWVSRLVQAMGHEVVVANARKVRAISQNKTKSDRVDAEMLARLGRADVKLLAPIRHRGEEAQADRAILRCRDTMVKARTSMILSVRGLVKSFGARLSSCSASAFANRVESAIPPALEPAVRPILSQVRILSQQIREYERLLEARWQASYQDARRMRQVAGIGAMTAIAYVTTIEDSARFSRSREGGPFLGVVPARDQSGDRDPRLPITKTGDATTRRLLVQSAHYILGPFGPACELREFGERIIARGGRGAKRRAAVAVARKLAVLLHRLWVGNEDYDPWYSKNRAHVAS